MDTPLASRPLRPRVAVAAFSSPLEVGADRAPEAATELAAVLTEAGCEVIALGAVGHPGQERCGRATLRRGARRRCRRGDGELV